MVLRVYVNIQKKMYRDVHHNGETLWLSVKNSNTLIAVDSENNEELIPILDYNNISIIKMVTDQKSMIVLEGSNAKDKSLFVFDCKAKEVLFVLPIKEHFNDIVITSYKTALLLCEEELRIPRRYLDEVDDEEILFWAELEWDQQFHRSNHQKINEALY